MKAAAFVTTLAGGITGLFFSTFVLGVTSAFHRAIGGGGDLVARSFGAAVLSTLIIALAALIQADRGSPKVLAVLILAATIGAFLLVGRVYVLPGFVLLAGMIMCFLVNRPSATQG